jgi:hypothetical protein
MAGQFSLDLSKFITKTKGNGRAVIRKVALDMGTSMALKTPVGDPTTWKLPDAAPAGYVGGRARGSWQYAKGAPDTTDPGTIDKTGDVSINRIAAGVAAGDELTQHFITSSVPYIRALEYEGHSKQAPAGMVRVTVVEFNDFVENAVGAVTR